MTGRVLFFQVTTDPDLDRLDHVWRPVATPALKLSHWKCVLCGAVEQDPPHYPTPPDYFPRVIEPLDDFERALCPPPKT